MKKEKCYYCAGTKRVPTDRNLKWIRDGKPVNEIDWVDCAVCDGTGETEVYEYTPGASLGEAYDILEENPFRKFSVSMQDCADYIEILEKEIRRLRESV